MLRTDIIKIPQYNLSSIYESKQIVNALDPLAWLESDEAQKLIEQTGQSHFDIFIDTVINVYIHDSWVFLAYIRHCFGNNLDTAINLSLKA